MPNNVLYGFQSLQHLWAQRVSEIGVDVISTAIQQSVEEHNRQLDAMLNLFAQRTTAFKTRFKTPLAARLQPLDQNGRAYPIVPIGQYDLAFPLQDGGTAWGANYKTRAKMTVQEANDITATMLSADMRWVRDHIMAALFANSAWTFTDPEHGSLTVQGLANNDSAVYQVMAGGDSGATDNHYLAQAAAISNTDDPFPVIKAELEEHPENGGQVVALIPSNLKTAVRGLAGFVPLADANLRLGANLSQLVGDLGVPVPGEVFGYHDDGVWLCEWRSLPSNYIIATTTEGVRPLAMREEPEPELQGFRQVATREDHPFWESQWLRSAGFGAWNRVGALVYRVGNASYAIPTGYASPMP